MSPINGALEHTVCLLPFNSYSHRSFGWIFTIRIKKEILINFKPYKKLGTSQTPPPPPIRLFPARVRANWRIYHENQLRRFRDTIDGDTKPDIMKPLYFNYLPNAPPPTDAVLTAAVLPNII